MMNEVRQMNRVRALLLAAGIAALAGCGGSNNSSVTPGNTNVFYATSVFMNTTTARAMGYNGFGQYGNGTTTSQSVPTRVATLPGIRGLVPGGQFILAFGTYTAWTAGYNYYSQLGRATTGKTQDESFAAVSGLSGLGPIAAAAAGGRHALLLIGDKVYAWGRNDLGQLGDNTATDRYAPAAVIDNAAPTSSLALILEVAAGGAHNLARNSSGKVYAWGYNAYGQLGNGATLNQLMAVQLPAFANQTTAKAIAAGSSFSLAIDAKDRLYAWGNNSSGQLGFSSLSTATRPRLVASIGTVDQVAAGVAHVLVRKGGEVWSWGYNGAGQLGDGGKISRETPKKVDITGTVTDIRAFGNSSFAKVGSTWYAWGDNIHGQLGLGTAAGTYVLTPQAVTGL
jgi:alpha-tubulin suppressor-like RCC1 family protein